MGGLTPSPLPDPLALVVRAKAGDRDAFASIFERHAADIRRLAYLLLHHADHAEDVVQETFARGLENLNSYRGESDPGAWLRAIAINFCRHVIRDRRNQAGRADAGKLESGRRPSRPRTRGPLTRAVQDERQRKLAVALGFLTEPQKEAFVLHHVDGRPFEEIAHILGVTAGAARSLAHRAKESLMERFGGDLSNLLP